MAFWDESTSKQDFRLKLCFYNQQNNWVFLRTYSYPQSTRKNVQQCQIAPNLEKIEHAKLYKALDDAKKSFRWYKNIYVRIA